MPVPVIDSQKRSDAYKKVPPVDGIAEQGLVPDPDVMHTLWLLLAIIRDPWTCGHFARDFRRQFRQHCLQFCGSDDGCERGFSARCCGAGLDYC